jgi:hypothetical protein
LLGSRRLAKLLAAVLDSGSEGSTAAPVEDGLLPACLFRSVAYDRAGSSLLVVPKVKSGRSLSQIQQVLGLSSNFHSAASRHRHALP